MLALYIFTMISNVYFHIFHIQSIQYTQLQASHKQFENKQSMRIYNTKAAHYFILTILIIQLNILITLSSKPDNIQSSNNVSVKQTKYDISEQNTSYNKQQEQQKQELNNDQQVVEKNNQKDGLQILLQRENKQTQINQNLIDNIRIQGNTQLQTEISEINQQINQQIDLKSAQNVQKQKQQANQINQEQISRGQQYVEKQQQQENYDQQQKSKVRQLKKPKRKPKKKNNKSQQQNKQQSHHSQRVEQYNKNNGLSIKDQVLSERQDETKGISQIKQQQKSAQTQMQQKQIVQDLNRIKHDQNIIFGPKIQQKNKSKQNQIIKQTTLEPQTINQQRKKPLVPKTKSNLYLPILGYLSSQIINYVSQFIKNTLPISITEYIQTLLYRAIDQMARQIIPMIRNYYQFYKILTDTSKPKTKKVYYQINYANLYGGAKIIMKSSPKIKSINSILQDGPDKYMYTDQSLPLKIIIGLNEQIAIDSLIIQSYQMYSCITKQFKVEGKFTLGDKRWVHLGTFKAQNIFGDQIFYLQRKIVRYIKLTIFSSYGKWSYFTLTQIKIRGKNLFADALTDKNSQKASVPEHEHLQSQSHKQQEEDRPSNTCQNQIFKPTSHEPQQRNLITSLITKIDNLQNKNTGQGKQIESLQAKLSDLAVLLSNKTQQNIIYQKLLLQYKSQAGRTFYVIVFSLCLSAITLCSLFCLCWIRRKQLLELNKNIKTTVKKSNSFD